MIKTRFAAFHGYVGGIIYHTRYFPRVDFFTVSVYPWLRLYRENYYICITLYVRVVQIVCMISPADLVPIFVKNRQQIVDHPSLLIYYLYMFIWSIEL